MRNIWIWLMVLSYALVAVLSYHFTDPNLYLSSHPLFVDFQNWVWGAVSRQQASIGYVVIVGWLFCCYALSLRQLGKMRTRSQNQSVLLLLAPMVVLMLGYNALSHDVFNYIFNGRMITAYGANPHVQVALDFAQDDWTRFMHNTHTPAPYGYGWTLVSLLPSLLGMGVFSLTWILFRLTALISVYGLVRTYYWWQNRAGEQLHTVQAAIFFWNPLVVLEVGLNMHNDLWMMVPAVLALGMVFFLKLKNRGSILLLSAALLTASISIKFATLVLVGLWCYWIVRDRITWLRLTVDQSVVLASILLFVPLLTPRSKQFLPWYLLWSLTWILFAKQPLTGRYALWWKWLLSLSFVALLRYVPWIWHAGYHDPVPAQQLSIVWLGGILVWLVWIGVAHLRRNHA